MWAVGLRCQLCSELGAGGERWTPRPDDIALLPSHGHRGERLRSLKRSGTGGARPNPEER